MISRIMKDKLSKKRPRFGSLLFTSIVLASAPMFLHQLQCDAAETNVNKNTLPKMTQPPPGSTDYSAGAELTLGDLRDIGLTIMQIKQQAINIFLEVTRKDVPKSARPELVNIAKISLTDLKPNATYLPIRPEWLTFYVGAMEPIIRLLGADVTDVRGGVAKLMVPKGNKGKFEGLYEEHEKDVARLNEHLTKIYDGIGEKNSNAAIAKEAVHIFEVAEDMEKTRVQAFHLIQGATGRELEELPIPKK